MVSIPLLAIHLPALTFVQSHPLISPLHRLFCRDVRAVAARLEGPQRTHLFPSSKGGDTETLKIDNRIKIDSGTESETINFSARTKCFFRCWLTV